ncbi:mechanosensitive ion channel family protein [filamentous cyanobacterium LEGE 11480]|uniref:Mechanosensitive ion channel family protein n=1 Tax=Romeriopsis navalis LEGE 11480 TaxID=2777977 RepID=A0A928Z3E5_9CYAN|nr:mechanosensitive ion channel family protein [Romeriopsis navalis LEGE 11480]
MIALIIIGIIWSSIFTGLGTTFANAAQSDPPNAQTTSNAQTKSDQQSLTNGSKARTLPNLEWVFEQFDTSKINTTFVRLDGRRLFRIATPAAQNITAESSSAEQRAKQIEMTLKDAIDDAVNRRPGSDLKVTSQVDSDSNLPIIYVDNKYLMTVTTLDGKVQGLQSQRTSQQIVQTIQTALSQAMTERQPQYLIKQGFVAGGISFIGGLLSLLFIRRKHQSIDRQQKLSTELESLCQADQPKSNNDTSSAASTQQHWDKIKLQQKLGTQKLKTRLYALVQVVLWSIIVAIIIGCFPQTRWLRPLLLATPLRMIAVIVGMYFFVRLGETIIDRILASVFQERQLLGKVTQRLSIRLDTLSQVLKSALALIISGAGVLAILATLGVDLVPVLAGAGIVGLAISFACQSLVKDVINGVLILLEDQYAVSDLVKIGNVTGAVETMNLRITQLRDAEGRLITIPNSTIDIVENLSKDWSRVNLTVDVDYRADPDRALFVLKRMAQQMYTESPWSSKIIEPPEVLGIDRLDHVGLQIRIWLKTLPLEQFTVAREFRRRLKRVMSDEDLGIGIPQQRLQAPNLSIENEPTDRAVTMSTANNSHIQPS